MSVSFGKYGEYVFSWNDSYICSYLEWNVTPLTFVGANFDFGFNNFEIDFSAAGGLPLKCGKMYDSDWNGEGIKKTYSIHENYSALNLDFEILFKYNFLFNQFTFSPVLQSEVEYNSFRSKNGHGWYGGSSYNTSGTGSDVSWDSPYAKHYKVSKIDLDRLDVYTFLGLDFEARFSERFYLLASTYFSPYTFSKDSDYHHDGKGKGRDFYITSTQNYAFLRFKEKLALQFNLPKMWALKLNVSWVFGPIAKGPLAEAEQKGGNDINVAKISFGIKKSW